MSLPASMPGFSPAPAPTPAPTAVTTFRGLAAVLGVSAVALAFLSFLPETMVTNDGGEGDLTLTKFAVVDAAVGALLAIAITMVVGALTCLVVASVIRRRGA